MPTVSVYKAILDAVQAAIVALDLEGIETTNIKIGKGITDAEKCFPGIPGVLILPFGKVGSSVASNLRDDIEYPVVIVLLADECTRTNDDYQEASGGDVADVRFDWTETVRRAFIHQRLTAVSSVWFCRHRDEVPVHPDAFRSRKLWWAQISLGFVSRETRG